jgi:hypothetical protein
MAFLSAPWPNLTSVGTLSTTREGGVSKPPFNSLNLGLHVDDDPEHVLKNRALVEQSLPNPPLWLNQVHSGDVLCVDADFNFQTLHSADALYTQVKNQPLAIMSPDCLPILFASHDGHEVAAVHGGWRGLEKGIIKNTLACFSSPSKQIYAWLGPAIGAEQFEVGAEVATQFIAKSPLFKEAFKLQSNNKYLCDIYLIARIELEQLGVINISGGDYCTVSQPSLFFSYRREGKTGRMASLIWRK